MLVLGEVSHDLDRLHEIAETATITPLDESDVGLWIDLQPIQSWRQVFRNAAALAFDHGASGPVRQLQVVLDFLKIGPLGTVLQLIGERWVSVPRSLTFATVVRPSDEYSRSRQASVLTQYLRRRSLALGTD